MTIAEAAPTFPSRIYVSSAIEGTQGVLAPLDKSFYVVDSKLSYREDMERDPVASGAVQPYSITRDSVKAGGSLTHFLHPDVAAWAFKMLTGASPVSSSLVAGSAVVHEHIFNDVAQPPATWSFFKRLADISHYTERWAGNGISRLTISSDGPDDIILELEVEGLGAQYALRAAEPSVTPVTAGEDRPVGINTRLLVDGSPLPAGVFGPTWSLTIDPGQGLLDTGGSTDGSATRFDLRDDRQLSATFVVIETDTVQLADFLAGSFHSYEFQAVGPVIDADTALTSLVSVEFPRARIARDFRSEITGSGVYRVPLTIEAVADPSTGFDHVLRVRNLQPTY